MTVRVVKSFLYEKTYSSAFCTNIEKLYVPDGIVATKNAIGKCCATYHRRDTYIGRYVRAYVRTYVISAAIRSDLRKRKGFANASCFPTSRLIRHYEIASDAHYQDLIKSNLDPY